MNNKQLLQKYVDTGVKLPEYQIRSLPDNLRNTYIRRRIIAVRQTGGLEDYEFILLTPIQRFQYSMKMAENGWHISDELYEILTPEQRFLYAMKKVEKGHNISVWKFALLTPGQRLQYVMKRVEKSWYITVEQFNLLTPEQQKIFKDNGGTLF
jgi:hypothetical protein